MSSEETGNQDASQEAGQEAAALAAKPGQVTPVDFSQPAKFTLELRRRIAAVMAPFLKAMTLRLSGDLKTEVQLRQLQPRELTWSAARTEIERGRVQALVGIRSQPGHIVIACELPLLLRAIECLLGGRAADAPQERELGDIDKALTARLMREITEQLALSWRDLGGLELELQEIVDKPGGKVNLDLPQAEAIYIVDLECEISGATAKVQILLPWSTVAPMAAETDDNEAELDATALARRTALHRSLSATKVQLRAEIGTTQMSVDEVLGLVDGDEVHLDAKAEKGVRIFADRIAIACGIPGRNGIYKAVQLTTAAEPRPPSATESLAPATMPGARRNGGSLREHLRHLSGVSVLVSAELGRAHLPLKTALRLPQGAVLELEQTFAEQVELYANGQHFAAGTLAVSADGNWCVTVGAAQRSEAEAIGVKTADQAPEDARADRTAVAQAPESPAEQTTQAVGLDDTQDAAPSIAA